MLFLLEWKFKEDCHEKAINRLINSNNNIENGKILEKFHSPGSVFGWLVAESSEVQNVNNYIKEESEFINWNMTPILKDSDAVIGLSYLFKNSKKN
tara:strand:+ start:191 stop:478 length:288 start_codon:yes stop_codon:yes gene_type:complete